MFKGLGVGAGHMLTHARRPHYLQPSPEYYKKHRLGNFRIDAPRFLDKIQISKTRIMSMYPPEIVEPMREEVLELGVEDLRTPEDVDRFLNEAKDSTALIFVNSVCGCSAANARPALRLALEKANKRPEFLGTVFAGVDTEATARAREYMSPYPPSSPSVALFVKGKLVYFMPREEIQGREAEEIAQDLITAFERYC